MGDLTRAERVNLLAARPVFEGLPADALDELTEAMELVDVKGGPSSLHAARRTRPSWSSFTAGSGLPLSTRTDLVTSSSNTSEAVASAKR
jgi:hypothetical protein